MRTRDRSARLRRGLPLLLLAVVAIVVGIVNSRSNPAGPQIQLRTAGSRQVTALVFGAGSGIQFVRASKDPVTLQADLAEGPLRIVALRPIQLAARSDDPIAHLYASGRVVQLKREGSRISVHTGF